MIVILSVTSTAFAQPLARREDSPLASWILSSSKDSTTISFAYSIPYSRLIFTRGSGIAQVSLGKQPFECELSFSTDATDSVTGINYHKLIHKKITTDGFSVTQDKNHLAEDIITMKLPTSIYKIASEVRDDNQQISYLIHGETKRLPDIAGLPTLVFADSVAKNIIFPSFLDNTAPFPKPISVAIIPTDTSVKALRVKLETSDGSMIEADSSFPTTASLVPSDSGGIVSFHLVPCQNHLFFLAKFKIDTLAQGRYTLLTDWGGRTDKIHFSYVWLDQPATLKDFKTALALLKYLAPDSVFDRINSGNEKEEKEKFDQFWKSLDPTPKTAYNELQAEYYERADFALENFRTVSEVDGTATDRGKAYILFGKPANVQREFREDGTYETWYYPNHKKELVFREEGAGHFVLYRTETL